MNQPEPASRNWRGCPCTVEGIEPCRPQCTCVNPVMSGGCSRCASYGSVEQRQAAARRIIASLSERGTLSADDQRVIEKLELNISDAKAFSRTDHFKLELKRDEAIEMWECCIIGMKARAAKGNAP